VEAIETHRSWVFLTELHAYKLKKPVSARGADYSSLGARRHHCEEEVRLNRRLASDVYLGVVPLVRAAGELQLVADRPLDAPPEGEVVDWLVLMRRVPRERMLDWQIAQGTLDPKLLASAITALARFYQRTERVAWTGKAYRSRLEREVLRYRRELDMPRFELAEDSLDEITNAQLELLHREPELFDLRAAERRIVDAHGDLRPEHIVLGPEPCVIDCIEFSRQLRLLDSASELSFLAIECARLGAPSLRDVIVNAYAEASSDRPPERLLDFYESHNACIRAVVALWHLDDPAIDSRSRWVKKARSYLRLAADRAHRLRAG
jgi:aminoglycoside phosphotransferase family enzyme